MVISKFEVSAGYDKLNINHIESYEVDCMKEDRYGLYYLLKDGTRIYADSKSDAKRRDPNFAFISKCCGFPYKKTMYNPIFEVYLPYGPDDEGIKVALARSVVGYVSRAQQLYYSMYKAACTEISAAEKTETQKEAI